MVAMSGAIMPAPLAMPLIVTLASPSFAVAVATFGKVSVVMMALAASRQPSGARVRARACPCTPSNFVASSGSPITPVEARKISSRRCSRPPGGELGRQFRRLRAGLAGEGVGVAGIDHQRAGLAALELGAAPVDRRRRAFRAGEHAGDRVPLSNHGQQHVGAALVADAGCGGGEAHAVDRGHLGTSSGASGETAVDMGRLLDG